MARELALQNGSGAGIMDGLYGQLTETMPTFQKQNLDYITGEQAISRLNDALGVDGWDFTVKRIWLDREADCVMCVGALTVRWPNGISSTHEDIGSQMPNRKKDGSFVELGSDFKGARTDCLKRCAADIGIGLWLYHKQSGSAFERPSAMAQPTTAHPAQKASPQPAAPQPDDSPDMALRRRYKRLLKRTQELGVPVVPLAIGSSVEQATKWCDITEQVIAAEQAARDAQAVPEAF